MKLRGVIYSIELSGIESSELTMSVSKRLTEKMKPYNLEAAGLKAE